MMDDLGSWEVRDLMIMDINGADPDHQDRGDSATPLPEYPRNADLRK